MLKDKCLTLREQRRIRQRRGDRMDCKPPGFTNINFVKLGYEFGWENILIVYLLISCYGISFIHHWYSLESLILSFLCNEKIYTQPISSLLLLNHTVGSPHLASINTMTPLPSSPPSFKPLQSSKQLQKESKHKHLQEFK
jgi:hypothetical protein